MSYTNLITHAVFSTKERYPFLSDLEVRSEVHAYLGGIVRGLKGTALTIGGVADHVHMLMVLPPTLAIADVMRGIKSNSSGWIHDRWRSLSKFRWQAKYAAFSVSRSAVERVGRYVEAQEEHHRHKTFEEELTELLEKHGVPYDGRYLLE
jgi:putative transposase